MPEGQINAAGGTIHIPILSWGKTTNEKEIAATNQHNLTTWFTIAEAKLAYQGREHLGPFTAQGFVAWPIDAKSAHVAGTGGGLFPLAYVKQTDYGMYPLVEDLKNPLTQKENTYFEALSWKETVRGISNTTPKPAVDDKGIVFRSATPGSLDNNYFFSLEPHIISHWRSLGANASSTQVSDVDDKGVRDKSRQGPLDFLTVVTYSPFEDRQLPVLNSFNRFPSKTSVPAANTTTSGTTTSGGSTNTSNSGGGTSKLHDPQANVVGYAFNLLGGERLGGVRTGGYSSATEKGQKLGQGYVTDPAYENYLKYLYEQRQAKAGNTGGVDAPGGFEEFVEEFQASGGGRGNAGGLRFIETGPAGPNHIGHGGDIWKVDEYLCPHIYSERNGIKEVSGHLEAGGNRGVHWKIRGTDKDGPLQFHNDLYKGTKFDGDIKEAKIKWDEKENHSWGNEIYPGMWKIEYYLAATPKKTITKVGDPVEPTICITPINVPGNVFVSPVCNPNGQGGTNPAPGDAGWPTDSIGEFYSPSVPGNITDNKQGEIYKEQKSASNKDKHDKAPVVGSAQSYAKQYYNGKPSYSKEDEDLDSNYPHYQSPATGGVCQVPAEVDIYNLDSKLDNWLPPSGTTERHDVIHPNVSTMYGGTPSVVTGQGFGGINMEIIGQDGTRQGSADDKTLVFQAVDEDGNEGADSDGSYRTEFQTKLSTGPAETITIASDSITPGNTVNIIMAAQSGTSDNLQAISSTFARNGDTLILSVDSGDTITLLTTANISIPSGSLLVLSGNSVAVVQWNSTASKWVVIASSTGSGSLGITRTSTSAPYSVLMSDHYVVVTTPGTVTLPTAVGVTGKEFIIKNTSVGLVQVASTGGQTFDGAPSPLNLNIQMSKSLVSNGSAWELI